LKYPKEVVLKDGSEAIIRPLETGDEPQLREFFARMPEADRWYMKYDVMDPKVLREWFEKLGSDRVHATAAISKDKIIGHASLHLQAFGCTKHIGRLRVVVIPEYRHKRLGTWMLLDLVRQAMDRGLEELRSDFVVGIEDGAIDAAYKLDFFKRAVLEDYVIGPGGERYDLLLMTKRLHKEWSDF
jgi:GNAT superfamily N-acetyltransferase